MAGDERGMHFNKGKSAIVILYPITKTKEEHPDSHFLIFLRREGFGKLQQSVFHHGSVQVITYLELAGTKGSGVAK